MPKAILLVATRPHEGQEADYHRWYDEEHLADVLAVDGFVAARRYEAVPSIHGELPELPYVAVYEIEADDLTAVQQRLSDAAHEVMTISPALAEMKTLTFRLITDGPTDG